MEGKQFLRISLPQIPVAKLYSASGTLVVVIETMVVSSRRQVKSDDDAIALGPRRSLLQPLL